MIKLRRCLFLGFAMVAWAGVVPSVGASEGAVLLGQEMSTEAPVNGGTLLLSDASGLLPTGSVIVEPGTSQEEVVTYGTIYEDSLVNIVRALPLAHPSGSSVAQLADAVPPLSGPIPNPFFAFNALETSDPGTLGNADGSVPVGVPAGTEWETTLAVSQVLPTTSLNTALNRCQQWSNNPHESDTEPGNMHAKGRIKCSWPPNQLYFAGKVWKHRWYGWQPLDEDEDGPRHTGNIDMVLTRECSGTYDYHLGNYGWIDWSFDDAEEAHMYTDNQNRFVC